MMSEVKLVDEKSQVGVSARARSLLHTCHWVSQQPMREEKDHKLCDDTGSVGLKQTNCSGVARVFADTIGVEISVRGGTM